MPALITQLPRRQAVRRALLLLSFIAFPVTMNYLSPYLIVDGAFNGIVSGSALVFASMFVGSMLLGRLWCGWVCPAAGIQEPLLRVNSTRLSPRADIAKWVVWIVWIAVIIAGVVSAGGYSSVQPLYQTAGGISVQGDAERPIIFAYIIYFAVVLTFMGLSLVLGRRAGCHTICWMAPFMILGRGIRNRLGSWPSLRLASDPAACTHCGSCTRSCPMSIDVETLVATGSVEHPECALCASCVDACPSKAIRYTFSAGGGRSGRS